MHLCMGRTIVWMHVTIWRYPPGQSDLDYLLQIINCWSRRVRFNGVRPCCELSRMRVFFGHMIKNRYLTIRYFARWRMCCGRKACQLRRKCKPRRKTPFARLVNEREEHGLPVNQIFKAQFQTRRWKKMSRPPAFEASASLYAEAIKSQSIITLGSLESRLSICKHSIGSRRRWG